MKRPQGNKKSAGGCETQTQAELGIEIGQQRIAPNEISGIKSSKR
jgi:hypothetical protein